MTQYLVAEGHDVALESLNPISPQPRSEGIKATRRTHLPDGGVQSDGPYLELEFSLLAGASAHQAVLAQFGLDSAATAAVTVYARDETFGWVRRNGTAVRPVPGDGVTWRSFFPRGVVILVRALAEPS